MTTRNSLIILIIIWLALGVVATLLNNISAEGDREHTAASNYTISLHRNF